MNKSRVIKDFETLSQELKEQVKLVYSDGFSHHLIEFRNAKGEIVQALPFETDDKIYLLKMSVRTAIKIIEDDDDFDDDGNLLDIIKEKYEDNYSEISYLTDNENYNSSDEDEDDNEKKKRKKNNQDDDDDLDDDDDIDNDEDDN